MSLTILKSLSCSPWSLLFCSSNLKSVCCHRMEHHLPRYRLLACPFIYSFWRIFLSCLLACNLTQTHSDNGLCQLYMGLGAGVIVQCQSPLTICKLRAQYDFWKVLCYGSGVKEAAIFTGKSHKSCNITAYVLHSERDVSRSETWELVVTSFTSYFAETSDLEDKH